MSDFYDDIIDMAAELLAEFGNRTNVCLRSRNAAAYDEIENEYTNESETNTPLLAVDLAYRTNVIDGSRIKANDRNVICSNEVEPKMEDTLIIGGIEHTIHAIKKVAPSGTDIIYMVQARS